MIDPILNRASEVSLQTFIAEQSQKVLTWWEDGVICLKLVDLIKYAIIACSVLGMEIQVEIIGYSLLLKSCIIQA